MERSSRIAELPAHALHDQAFFQLASECPVEAWLSVLGHRWNALILYHLSIEKRRFGDIGKCLPTITPKVLTDRLVELERRGLVARSDSHRRAHYQLTQSGIALMPILHALEVWSRTAPLSDRAVPATVVAAAVASENPSG